MYPRNLFQKVIFVYICDMSQRTRDKDNIKSFMSALYLDILQNKDINGKLTIQLYDKRDDSNFYDVNFPYLYSNIPSSWYICLTTLSIRKSMFCM